MYPSLWQILLILVIFLLLFGHKKIREFGKSLGEGLRDFKKGLEGKTETPENQQAPTSAESNTHSQEQTAPTSAESGTHSQEHTPSSPTEKPE